MGQLRKLLSVVLAFELVGYVYIYRKQEQIFKDYLSVRKWGQQNHRICFPLFIVYINYKGLHLNLETYFIVFIESAHWADWI